MAAFDFPNNPTTGDIYSPGTGTSYRWDGGKWVIQSSGGGSGEVEEAPNDGQAYARQSGGWTPTTQVPVSISSNTLGELSDVTLTSASPGEALIYDGAKWVNGGDFSGGNF